MGNKEVICYINIFSNIQKIQGTSIILNLEDESFIPSLYAYANQTGAKVVHLFGNEDFIKGLVESAPVTEYKERIEVKIN